MNICAYYEPLDSYNDANHAQLLELWQNSWRQQGFTPHVLGRSDAEAHQCHASLMAAVATFPTVNPRAYEDACYRRWCAFASYGLTVNEPYVAADYDVFPTVHFRREVVKSVAHIGLVNYGHLPSFVSGRRWHFEQIIDILRHHRPDPACRHTADMTILRANKRIFNVDAHKVLCYGQPEWRSRPLVHFGNWFMPQDRLRVDVIRGLLDFSGQVRVTL